MVATTSPISRRICFSRVPAEGALYCSASVLTASIVAPDASLGAPGSSLLSISRRIRIAHIPRQGITSMNGIHVTNMYSANA
jgi:hypothetical protein